MIDAFGWDRDWAVRFIPYAAGRVPARVLADHRGRCELATADGPRWGIVPGRLLHDAAPAELPVVGDWVAARAASGGPLVMDAVLPRRSRLSRRAAGSRTEEQVLAANVDLAFVLMGLDGNYRVARAERLVTAVAGPGVQPVVLLTKADTCDDVAARVAEVQAVVGETPVHAVSVPAGVGLEVLDEYLAPGLTAVLIGSSGVGKSTLANHLLGRDALSAQTVREGDSRGRHTTSSRSLLLLPGGALLIDTPGLREFQLWDAEAGLEELFGDLDRLAEGCRFRDCRHESEPGCRIREGLGDGSIDPVRWQAWSKLRAEAERRQVERDTHEARRRERAFSRMVREHQKHPKR